MQLAQLSRDGDVAAPMPEANGGREIEGPLSFARLSSPPFRRRNAELAIKKIDDQSIALCRNAAQGIVPAVRNGHEFGAGDFGNELCTRIGLDLVVVAMDHQHGAVDLAVHRLADIERRRDRARLHRFRLHRSRRLVRPVDAVLDLLGRVRLGKDVADRSDRRSRDNSPANTRGCTYSSRRYRSCLAIEMLRSSGRGSWARYVPAVPASMAALTRSGWCAASTHA